MSIVHTTRHAYEIMVLIAYLHKILDKHFFAQQSKRTPKIGFQYNYRLMQVKSIAECSILQYFRPSLSYHLPLRPLLYLFLSGCLSQVLLHGFQAFT